MVKADSVSDLRERLQVIKDEILDREQERDHIEALLKMWGRRKGKNRSPKPAEQPPPEWAARHQGGTKQDKIVQEVKRVLESLPTRSADFADVFKLLRPEIVGEGNGAREYTRTSILRLGSVYGVTYAQGGRLSLHYVQGGMTGIIDPFEGVRSSNAAHPFENAANET